ncbi:MAG: F0F1 ATP synthase subunit delta [Aeromicrobium sp.]
MRGISAKSLAKVLEAVNADTGQVNELGDELFDVVGVLDGAPALRRVLTDPSTEDQAKAELAASIFGGKVGDGTLKVITVAVQSRWSSGRDLADGLETAGVTAHVAAADKAGELDALETELFDFNRVIVGDSELRQVITDRTVPTQPKATLVGKLIDGKVSKATAALAKQAVAARTGSFDKALAAFADTAAARRNRLLAQVRVAYAMGDDEKQRLAAALAAKYGREVHINTIVDPDVVGGISVAIGDEIVDGTVSSRLEDARRRIAG